MLSNKVVVVTGGAGLIGRNFCEAIVQNNGIAIIADINKELMKKVKDDIQAKFKDAQIFSFKLDITSKESIKNLIANLNDKFGKIDALVNNAYPKNAMWCKKNFFEAEYKDVCENMNMQLGGYFLCSQQFSIYFKEQGYGNIISMASIMGVYVPKFQNYKGTSMDSPIEYSIVKAGVVHMTKWMAKYLANTGIRCNSIAPGGVFDNQPESFLKAYRECCTSKGMLDANDISGTLVYLLSDMSRYVNGQTIVVDDGWGL